MNTGFRGVLPVYDIFGCASYFASNFRHLTPTTLNCGATDKTTKDENKRKDNAVHGCPAFLSIKA